MLSCTSVLATAHKKLILDESQATAWYLLANSYSNVKLSEFFLHTVFQLAKTSYRTQNTLIQRQTVRPSEATAREMATSRRECRLNVLKRADSVPRYLA